MLTDRGLDAALSALAARSPVPVEIDVQLDRRPPASIEAAAYFVVAESLANIAKHSRRPTGVGAGRRARPARSRSRSATTASAARSSTPAAASRGLRDRIVAVEGTAAGVEPARRARRLLAVELPCES